MAAGRVDVTRRGDFHYYRKNSFCDRNGFHDLVYGQDHAQSRKIRYGVGSCSRLVGEGGDRCRKINGGSGGCKVDDLSGQGRCKSVLVNMSVVGDNEILQFEDGGGSIPTAKRRKFSPVVWDRVDKEVRISSRSRIVKKSTLPCSSPTLVHGELHNVIVDDVSTHLLQTDQHQEKHMSPAESHVATGLVGNFGAKGFDCSTNLLPPEQCNKSIADLDEEKGVEHAEVQCISMSRWATKEDSPQQLCLRNNKRISPRTMVGVNTPEIGEFLVGSNQESGSDCLDYEVDSCDFLEIDESETQSEDGEGTSMLGKPADPKPRCMNMLHGCRSVFEFEKLGRICEGTYGIVYKARDKESGELVALKKVKMGRENEGFPLTALREINLLLALNHPSIVNVKEVVMDGDKNVFMVMEYMEYDLRRLIEVLKQPFTEIEVKCLMRQLLEGLRCLHDNWILHRDLKTSNLLISNTGKLKLCDFGMSRQYGSPLKPYTSLVVTLWYRAPELLLGAKQYSTAVDMWSVGCIMAELIAKQPLFDGANEVRQLDKIFTTLGLPTEVTWPGFADLPGAKASFIEQSKNTLRDKFPALSFKGSPILSEQGFDLLSKLLTYDPDKRITAKAALEHSWFHVDSEQERLWTQESLAKKIKALSYYGHSF